MFLQRAVRGLPGRLLLSDRRTSTERRGELAQVSISMSSPCCDAARNSDTSSARCACVVAIACADGRAGPTLIPLFDAPQRLRGCRVERAAKQR